MKFALLYAAGMLTGAAMVTAASIPTTSILRPPTSAAMVVFPCDQAAKGWSGVVFYAAVQDGHTTELHRSVCGDGLVVGSAK